MKALHRELQLFGCRNATFLLALILIASPVAGLRPIRCALPGLQDGKAGALLQILSECEPRKPGRTSKMARRFAWLKSAGPLFDCGDLNGRHVPPPAVATPRALMELNQRITRARR